MFWRSGGRQWWSARRRRGTGRLNVAMIGQKGLPATFGGIEHHVEQLGYRLAEQGVDVTVYCRESYADSTPADYRGMHLVVTPTVASKHLDAIVHSITSTVHALWSGADVIHYHALGPGLAAVLPRYVSSAKVVLTVHGLDHERAKWSAPARMVLGLAYRLSGHVPDRVITVSQGLAEHYRDRFGITPTFIPNGVPEPRPGPLPERLRQLGIEPGRYALFVGRLVPEKRPDLLIDAAAHLPDGYTVVLAGDSSFSDEYVSSIRAQAAADPRVILPGYVFGEDLAALYSNAAVFVQPSDLEGLPLTLLEATSYGVPVVASDIPPHVEVLGACRCGAHRLIPAGDADQLGKEMGIVISDMAAPEAAAGEAAALLEPFDWDRAAVSLRVLYQTLARER